MEKIILGKRSGEVAPDSSLPKGPQSKKISQFEYFISLTLGLIAGRVFGAEALIPIVFLFVTYLSLKKDLSPEKQFINIPASIQAGQMFGFIIALLFVGVGGLIKVGPDILVLLIGLGWLLRKPGKAPLIFLSVYQLFGVIVAVLSFGNLATADNWKSIAVYMTIRVSSLVYMGIAYKQVPKSKKVTVPGTSGT